MRIDTKFLHSKVARRIFVMFICCALIPITILALLSFQQVTQELKRQSQGRLQRSAKAVGMGIIERLGILETHIKVMALNANPRAKTDITILEGPIRNDLNPWPL